MSVRRALVECVVLSVQDACVFYPCCKGCFSRIDVERQDATRCRCSKCGYSCLREQVDYRYRLSLKVTRDRCIFGITVFGACLNPFFGIHASGLQRLVENFDGPVGAATRTTLLAKAVKDCFLGRHFIFGIKVTGAKSGLCFEGPVVNGSSSKDTVQFIASQMILPKAAGLGGCTVVSYYRLLLQKAAEYEQGSTDPSNTRPPETTLLLIPHHSPASSFNNSTFSASRLFSQSLLRSQDQDCTLSPTPPWQQSLGLVTSSAEQEEGCNTQGVGDGNSQQTDNNKTPHRVQRGFLENHKATEERTLSPVLSLERSCYNSPSFAKYPYTSFNTPILNTWLSPSQPEHRRDSPLSCKTERFPTRQLSQTFLSSSLAWEDLPFSESLTEFVVEEHKDFHIASKAEPHENVQNQKEMVRNNLEIRSQGKNSSIESTSVFHSNSQTAESYARMLLDVTNTPAANSGGDRHNLSDQVCKNSVVCVNRSQAKSVCFRQEDEEASSLSFENKEEEHLEGDTYNCSADLFGSSLMSDMNTKTLSVDAETVRTATEACPLHYNQHLRSENANVAYSTPNKPKLKTNKCINRDSLIPLGTQELDFIPPSQSTPIVKRAVLSGSPASSYPSLTVGEFILQEDSQDLCAFYSNLPEVDSRKTASITSSLCRLNAVSTDQLSDCGRESAKENMMWDIKSSRRNHRFTPKRRFWKPNKHKNHLLAQQHLRVQRGAERVNHKRDSSVCDVTVCDYEDSDIIVLPTPVAKTQLNVKVRRRRQTDNSSSDLVSTWKEQHEVNCKGYLLAHHPSSLTSSQRGLEQAGSCDSDMVDERSLDGSKGYVLDEENQACDWSRDLFSDSA
ncbi:DNA damage-induced apoptosis suppressor protein [Toxotes jaculatrix]|uniref:DNA damage-induced apoptosis suppressor protein n=1 Tax=Toxotes jaculatrix TaxID=941984 RepID=UPI001B3AC801|nr:DNA damage-induced apoptosis suppressor protein [Toxotes jaculatrix]